MNTKSELADPETIKKKKAVKKSGEGEKKINWLLTQKDHQKEKA